MRRNKQHEWSTPDMKSCFNCGYTTHLISEYSVRQYQPGYYQRQMQEKQMRYVQDQMKQDIIIKGLKEENIRRRNDDVRNYGDHEQEMYEWDKGEDNFEDVQSSNTRASILTRPRNVQNRSTNSIHRA
ncbi:8264_t:CDS:2, partial [Rhizophagus irregularis]